jgi:hypothetical protein
MDRYCTNYLCMTGSVQIIFAVQTLKRDLWYSYPHVIRYAIVGHCRGIYGHYIVFN